MYDTIQITSDEDRIISEIKETLGFSTKKAVIVAGLRALQNQYNKVQQIERLKKASLAVREESLKDNLEFSSFAYVVSDEYKS